MIFLFLRNVGYAILLAFAVVVFVIPVILTMRAAGNWWVLTYVIECTLLGCAGFAWAEASSKKHE